MNFPLTTRDLQGFSELKANVLGGSSLGTIKVIYYKTHWNLSFELLRFAFCHATNMEVLRFFTQQEMLDDNDIADLIGRAFVKAITVFQTGDEVDGSSCTEHLLNLVKEFPRCMVNRNCSSNFCPLNIAMLSPFIPASILDAMVGKFRLSDEFKLRRNNQLPPGFVSQMGDRCFEAIATILSKVTTFYCFRFELSIQERSKLFTLLFCREANKAVHVCLDFERRSPMPSPIEDYMRDRMKECPVTELSITDPAATLVAMIPQLNELRRLDFRRVGVVGRSIDRTDCDSVCRLLEKGKLEVLNMVGKTATEGLLLPLLDAVGTSKSLSELRLLGIESSQDEKLYQKRVLEILQSNTHLNVACISRGGFWKIYHLYLPRSSVLLTEQFGGAWYSNISRSATQKEIDYLGLSNMAGRAKARHTSHTSLQSFRGLLGKVDDKLDFLRDANPASRDITIQNVLYGLLREHPTLWLPWKRVVLPGTLQRGCKRKRKTSAAEVKASQQGALMRWRLTGSCSSKLPPASTTDA